jgi:hypothetical protein
VTVRIGRRSMLALSAAGALAVALPSCGSQEQSEEPYELASYGYDPDVPEPGRPEPPRRLDKVPPAASVRGEWLPPVGRQTMPNCFVWGSVYGLATFYAARSSGTAPTTPDRQAGPDYAYIRYEFANKTPTTSATVARSPSVWIGFNPTVALRRWLRPPTTASRGPNHRV